MRAEEVILSACMDAEKDRRVAGMSADQMRSTRHQPVLIEHADVTEHRLQEFSLSMVEGM
jgi:hypothetical protein